MTDIPAEVVWNWLVPVCLFGPFIYLVILMFIEDRRSRKWEDRDV